MKCEKTRRLLAFDIDAARKKNAVRRHCNSCAECDSMRLEFERNDANFATELEDMLDGVDMPSDMFARIQHRLGRDPEICGAMQWFDFTEAAHRWLPKLGYATLSFAISVLLLICAIEQPTLFGFIDPEPIVPNVERMEYLLP